MQMPVLSLTVIGLVLFSPLGLSAADSPLSGKDGAPMVLIPSGSLPDGCPAW